MPFFSVLVPTRNRVSLLKEAVPTAINQEFDDYEILISDNNSIDSTGEVARSFANQSDKVRHLSTGRDLSMLDHFEFIVSKARGKYFISLCDDDGFAPNTLSYLHDLLTHFPTDVLTWRYAGYGHPDIPAGDDSRCTLTVTHTSGNLFQVSSRPMMEALCRFDIMVYGIVPKIINSAISIEKINKCREKTGRFFVPPYPDFSTACQLLSTDDSYLFIDLPMYIAGESKLSNTGLRFNRKPKTDDYNSLFDRDLLEGVPYAMRYLTTSYLYATWLLFQKVYPETFPQEIDVKAFLNRLFDELITFEPYDDLTEEFDTLAGYMKDFSGDDKMFRRIWENYQNSKDGIASNGTSAGAVQQFKSRAWKVARKNEHLYALLARLRGHRLETTFHRNVPNIEAASKLLRQYIIQTAIPVNDLTPVPVDSSNFLQEAKTVSVAAS